MHTDFGGRGLSGFGDKINFMSIKVKKIRIRREREEIFIRLYV